MWTSFLWFSLAFVSLRAQDANPLRGHHFRISAMLVTPYLFKVNHSDGPKFQGTTVEMMNFVFDPQLNASYEFVFVDPQEIKAMGFINATINQLVTGQVDVSTLGYIPTAERYRIMDFSIPATITQNVLIVPYPKEKSKLAGLVRPFQHSVWICLLVAFGLLVFVVSLLTKYHEMGSTERQVPFANHLSDNGIYILTVLVGNGEYFRRKTLWLRLVIASWCLTCVVITYAYTGNLTSYLTIPAMESIPNSFEELAARSDLKITVAKNTIWANTILASSTGPLKILGDQLRRNPDNLYLNFETIEKISNRIATNNLALPAVVAQADAMLISAFESHGKCTLTYSKPVSGDQLYVYALPKNGAHNQAFNSRLQYMWDMGLLNHWYSKYIKRADKCLPGKKEPPKRSALKLEDLSSSFLLLACGLTLSLLVFLLELITGKHRK